MRREDFINLMRDRITPSTIKAICKELELSDKTYDKILSIFDKVKDLKLGKKDKKSRGRQDRTNKVKLASSIYIASKLSGESRTAKEIAYILNVTQASIYKCTKEIVDIIGS